MWCALFRGVLIVDEVGPRCCVNEARPHSNHSLDMNGRCGGGPVGISLEGGLKKIGRRCAFDLEKGSSTGFPAVKRPRGRRSGGVAPTSPLVCQELPRP